MASIYVEYRDFLHDESCDYNVPPSFISSPQRGEDKGEEFI